MEVFKKMNITDGFERRSYLELLELWFFTNKL
jgi:hypothetical protein